MEIERKWLFDSIIAPKDIPILGEFYYNQAYLSVNPEVRIRSKRSVDNDEYTYVLCLKSKGTLERIEVQKELTKHEFQQLMILGKLKEEDFIHKHFFTYYIDGFELTLGIADIGKATQFIYGEIEFKTVEEAEKFKAPSWFGKEVTNDKKFKMANYWSSTRNINKK